MSKEKLINKLEKIYNSKDKLPEFESEYVDVTYEDSCITIGITNNCGNEEQFDFDDFEELKTWLENLQAMIDHFNG